ncbi:MAG: NADH-quinone oxidoreductase subunit D [Anaerolineaceae bacterium]|nr:NADH-quinone oxidoreductase subunit D [Anaerolineaceae bacterium]
MSDSSIQIEPSSADSTYNDLIAQFPGLIEMETRPGFTGVVVSTVAIRKVMLYLKEQCGFDYLTSLTAVDDFPEDKIEIIYHLYKTTGSPIIELKIFTTRESPVVPSVMPVYPGADFQEREVWDLFGVHFEGHPDLRRLLLWEGFAGHPLRKDWKEPLFEEDVKPFKSRWPEGKGIHRESLNPFNDNVQYPKEFDPNGFTPDNDESVYKILQSKIPAGSDDLKVEHMIVNLGPQHPSTHGVFRMAALLEGEKVLALKPVIGYMHRNHEKIGERNTWLQNMPYTDRLDYLSSMSNNFGYALAVEKLLGIQPPERAEFLRVMMAELTRIASHAMAIGFLLNDLGAFFTPSLYALEERELILDIFESVAGSRMMCNYFRFGGVVRDITEADFKQIKKLVEDRLPRKIDDIDLYLTENEIVQARCEGVGVLTAEEAIAFSESGPMLRASGVPYDIRKADPYSIYDQLEFDVCYRQHGDVYDRYLVRLDEIRQSIRILQQVIKYMPQGPIQTGKVQYAVRVPAGEAYGRVEGPRGELGFYVVSDGKANPKRYHVRAPSLMNCTGLEKMCVGGKIADAVTILGAVDVVLGEVDR